MSTPIRLSDLAGALRRTLENTFGDRVYWVLADVTGYKHYEQKKHHYFDLVEKGPQGITTKINAVAWSEGDKKIKAFEKSTGQKFGNDIHVLVCVTVDFHVIYGLKLTLLDIDARFTMGQLEEQRQATLRKLLQDCPDKIWKVGDNYVTANSSLRLPRVIQRIAVISSASSAGYEDFMHSLSDEEHGYRFRVDPYFTRVQGQDNTDELADRIYEAAGRKGAYDALVIIRGGGTQTDFLIFNQYRIARAVAECPIPVITGIGHLRDQSITDLMAHTVTKTPTACAQFIIEHNRRFEEDILALQKNILLRAQQTLALENRTLTLTQMSFSRDVQQTLNRKRQQLTECHNRLLNQSRQMLHQEYRQLDLLAGHVFIRPQLILSNRHRDLVEWQGKMRSFVSFLLQQQSSQVAHFRTLIRLSAPDEVLKRGFALVKKSGKIISDPRLIEAQEQIQIILRDTEINVLVEHKKKYDGKDFDL